MLKVQSAKLYSVSQVAEMLNICTKTVYRMIRRSELSAVSISKGERKSYRISGSSLRNWYNMETRATNADTEYVKIDPRWML
jgi:excisionase family DNA binding protein